MNHSIRTRLRRLSAPAATIAALAALAAPAAALAEGGGPADARPAAKVSFHDADRENWKDCDGLPGCTFYQAKGDPGTGPSEAVFTFKAGTPFAPHHHTSPEHVVGVQGIMVYKIEGKTYHVGPGDHLYYPGKAVHSGYCSEGSDCVFYVYDDRPYDIFPDKN